MRKRSETYALARSEYALARSKYALARNEYTLARSDYTSKWVFNDPLSLTLNPELSS